MLIDPFRRRTWLPILFVLVAAAASAQQKLLTLDDIYDPEKKVDFSGRPPTGLKWIDASHYVWRRGAGEADWMKVDATTGSSQPLFDAAKMEAALAKLPGVSPNEARRLVHSRDLVFNDKYSAALVTIAADIYLYSPDRNNAVRLTYTPGEEEAPSFSPDGSVVGFVRENNLYIVEVATGRETAVTADGTAKISNGKLDWVYEEEIYGRGQKRAYWWSPDSSRIAFLQIDDRPVSTFLTIDDIPYGQTVETWEYPRAGDPNPIARLGVVRAAGGT